MRSRRSGTACEAFELPHRLLGSSLRRTQTQTTTIATEPTLAQAKAWISTSISTVCLVVALWSVWTVIDWGFLKGEITDYKAQCSGTVKRGKCIGRSTALTSFTYKPLVEQQVVLQWNQRFGPERLSQCVVVNRTNWTCRYDDQGIEYGFREGTYFWRRTARRCTPCLAWSICSWGRTDEPHHPCEAVLSESSAQSVNWTQVSTHEKSGTIPSMVEHRVEFSSDDTRIVSSTGSVRADHCHVMRGREDRPPHQLDMGPQVPLDGEGHRVRHYPEG